MIISYWLFLTMTFFMFICGILIGAIIMAFRTVPKNNEIQNLIKECAKLKRSATNWELDCSYYRNIAFKNQEPIIVLSDEINNIKQYMEYPFSRKTLLIEKTIWDILVEIIDWREIDRSRVRAKKFDDNLLSWKGRKVSFLADKSIELHGIIKEIAKNL